MRAVAEAGGTAHLFATDLTELAANQTLATAAYVFLASDEASYVSGSVVGVTGGKPVF